jgi:hypothetical protein
MRMTASRGNCGLIPGVELTILATGKATIPATNPRFLKAKQTFRQHLLDNFSSSSTPKS